MSSSARVGDDQDRPTATEVIRPVDDLADWRTLGLGLTAWFDAPSLTAGAVLVGRIAELSQQHGLPDVDLRASGVRVRVEAAAPELARAISAAAHDLGLAADPAALQTVRLAIDTAGDSSVRSFWQTVLAFDAVDADSLTDPCRRDPAISFSPLDQPRPLRNRMHVDVVRPAEAVAAVTTAIGQQPYGVFGLTLADPDGNEVDLVPGDELAPETTDWVVVFGAMTYYPVASPTRAHELAAVVAALADDAGVPVLVDLRSDGVTIDSGKDQWEDDDHQAGTRFAALAAQIQSAAHDRGLTADTTRLRLVQLGIDAVDIPAVRAFWTVALGYRHDLRDDLTDIFDPRRLNPVIMFQDLDADDERRRQRDRLHLDLVVPADQAQARVDAAIAAGGQVLSQTAGRWTVADPEGNELGIVTAG